MSSIHEHDLKFDNGYADIHTHMSIEEKKDFIEHLRLDEQLLNINNQKHRALSFTVGTAFGGSVEINLRNQHTHLYCILQPVEAVEILAQLAAACGCNIDITPRNDFSSWREWNLPNEELLSYYSNNKILKEDFKLSKGLSSENLQKQIEFLIEMKRRVDIEEKQIDQLTSGKENVNTLAT